MSQGYDGALVMSGHCSGVQQQIKQVVPQAVYVHCYTHCLNLSLVDTTRKVPEAADFFVLMETLYVFLTSSKAHANSNINWIQKVKSGNFSTCQTHNGPAVDAVYFTYSAVLATLQIITEGNDRAKAVEAEGILL